MNSTGSSFKKLILFSMFFGSMFGAWHGVYKTFDANTDAAIAEFWTREAEWAFQELVSHRRDQLHQVLDPGAADILLNPLLHHEYRVDRARDIADLSRPDLPPRTFEFLGYVDGAPKLRVTSTHPGWVNPVDSALLISTPFDALDNGGMLDPAPLIRRNGQNSD